MKSKWVNKETHNFNFSVCQAKTEIMTLILREIRQMEGLVWSHSSLQPWLTQEQGSTHPGPGKSLLFFFLLGHFGEATKRSPKPGLPPRALVSGFSREHNLSSKIFDYGVYSFDFWPYTYWRLCLLPRINYLWEESKQNTWSSSCPCVL